MPNAPTTPAGAPAAPQSTTAQPGQQPDKGGHHSARQPRDDGKRFAGPPAPEGGQPPETMQPAAVTRFTRKVKRNGAEVEESADLEELWRYRDEVDRYKALERASTQRFQRASELTKQNETIQQVVEGLEKGDLDPVRRYFQGKNLGPKEVKEKLADLLEAAIEDEELSPEQRELIQLRAEKAALEARERQRGEDEEAKKFEAEVDALRPQVEQVWKHALEQTSLPKTPEMMEATARIFLEAAEAGTRLSPEQVAEYARWELVEANGGLVNELEPAQFLKHFAPLAKKLDENLSAEDFEKALPALARRYHQLLVSRIRGTASTRGGTKPARPAPVEPKPQDERMLLDPTLDFLNH